MSKNMEVERMRTHAGTRVIGTVNRKAEIDTLRLADAGFVVDRAFVALKREGTNPIPIGSALIALMSSREKDTEGMPALKLTEEYSNMRKVSLLIDFLVPFEEWKNCRKPPSSSGQRWETVKPIELFSITFESNEGRKITVETIPGSCMYRLEALGKEVFANIIPVPAEMLSQAKGKLRVTELGMQDIPEVMAHKIIRASGQDMEDLEGIATLNSLPSLLRDSGHKLLLAESGRRTKENPEWLRQFRGKIMRVITALSKVGHNEGKISREQNIEFLSGIVSGNKNA